MMIENLKGGFGGLRVSRGQMTLIMFHITPAWPQGHTGDTSLLIANEKSQMKFNPLKRRFNTISRSA